MSATEAEPIKYPEAVVEDPRVDCLPALRQPFQGGIFAGVTTQADGKHCAIVLLKDKPQRYLTWKQAKAWARNLGAQLPSCAVAAHLFYLHPDLFGRIWYWTSESRDSMYSWMFSFEDGTRNASGIMNDVGAFAVKLIPLAEPIEAADLAQRVAAMEAKFETHALRKRVEALEALSAQAA